MEAIGLKAEEKLWIILQKPFCYEVYMLPLSADAVPTPALRRAQPQSTDPIWLTAMLGLWGDTKKSANLTQSVFTTPEAQLSLRIAQQDDPHLSFWNITKWCTNMLYCYCYISGCLGLLWREGILHFLNFTSVSCSVEQSIIFTLYRNCCWAFVLHWIIVPACLTWEWHSRW